MHLVISFDNYSQIFLGSSYPQITRLTLDELDNTMVTRELLRLFPNLKSLECNNCDLDSLSFLKGCKKLLELSCRENNLVNLKGLRYVPNLKKIDCSHNRLYSTSDFRFCPQLKSITCSFNYLKYIGGLERCRELEYLACHYNPLLSLDFLKECRSLIALDISDSKIDDLSPLGNLPTIKFIACSNTNITNLKGLEKLLSLEKLISPQCVFLTDTSSISACTKLKYLNLSSCGYASSDKQITKMCNFSSFSKLEKLILNWNKIRTFPDISKCPKLVTLSLAMNKLKKIPNLETNSRLEKLELSNNQIKDFQDIGNLDSLTYLDISHNHLESSKGLRGLPSLKLLNLSSNRITNVDEIVHCQNLQSLLISSNQLQTVDSISKVQSIENLELNYNRISNIEPLLNLVNLKQFRVAGNRFERNNRIVRLLILQIKSRDIIQTIYDDPQNTHDTTVGKSIVNSVKELSKEGIPALNLKVISSFQKKAIDLILDFCSDPTIHSKANITYTQLLALILAKIETSKDKEEICKILEETILASQKICFMGRFNSTLSVLVGFIDNIEVRISDSERLGGVIAQIGKKIIPYDPQEHYNQALEWMKSQEATKEDMENWLAPIRELIDFFSD